MIVQGTEVIPIEFAVAYIISRRRRLLEKAGLTEPTGCLKVEVKGKKDGEPHTYVFSMFSSGAGAGEGTGIPAALGAMLMKEGKITEKGVFPPEAGVKPAEDAGAGRGSDEGDGLGEGGVPIYIEHIDKDGNVESIDFRSVGRSNDDLLIGHDIGTGGSKAVLADQRATSWRAL